MSYKLSILIPSLESRAESFLKLYDEFMRQCGDRYGKEVQILSCVDKGEKSIGAKRNILLDKAEGEYLCFFDDDDEPSRSYIDLVLEGCESGADAVSLRGIYTVDGSVDHPDSGIFEHSIKYPEWKTNYTGVPKYERCINHLNAIKSSIAKQFRFPEINHGEDRVWSEAIHASGLIKTEHFIDKVIYHYRYVSKK